MMQTSSFQWSVVLATSLVAAVADMHNHRIPNWLTLPLVTAGLLVAAWKGAAAGFIDSVAACALLGLPYVLLFALAGGGAGDAKMMGALGAWLGLHDGLIVLLAVAVVGGGFGLIQMLTGKNPKARFRNFFIGIYVFLLTARSGRKDWDLLRAEAPRQGNGKNGHENRHGPEAMMPYGPAIFLGVCIGAIVVHLWQG